MANENHPQVTLGQELWFVPRDARFSPHAVTVTMIEGKRVTWVKLERGLYRFRLSQYGPPWIVDGGHRLSPGVVYRSQAEHREEVELERAWDAFCEATEGCGGPPRGMTADRIEAITRELFPEVHGGK